MAYCIDGAPEVYQLILPKAHRAKVLDQLLVSRAGGHGLKGTLAWIGEKYYWVTCLRDVEKWCKRCDI